MQMIAAIAAGALLASHPALSLVFTGIKTNANGYSVPPEVTHGVQCVTKIAFDRAVAANSAKKGRARIRRQKMYHAIATRWTPGYSNPSADCTGCDARCSLRTKSTAGGES